MSENDYTLAAFIIAITVGVIVLADGLSGGAVGGLITRLFARRRPQG